jgi:hypothetical protein
LREIDYVGDLPRLRDWLGGLLRKEPPRIRVSGIWFGLLNPIGADGIAASDLAVAASAACDPEDRSFDWIYRCQYLPQKTAGSAALRDAYRVAYRGTGSLGNDAEYAVCLGYATLAVKNLMADFDPATIPDRADRVAIAVGFNDGDFLGLGELLADGFRLEVSGA